MTSAGKGDASCKTVALKAANRRLIPGVNDLKTLYPNIAAEAHGWDPSTVSKGSKKSKSWKCPKGHIYQMRVAHRTCIYGERRKGAGCRICNKNLKIKVTSRNNLKALLPDVASEIIGVDPRNVYVKDRSLFVFSCPAGHLYKSRLWMQITKYGRKYCHKESGPKGCPFCQNLQALQGFNDLATINPQIAAEADGWDPSKIGFNCHKRKPWKWSCGHFYLMSPALRIKARGAGSHCPGCSHGGGFKRTKPAFLYLISRSGQFQFGVTNNPANRIGCTHKRNGWDLIDCASSMFGEEVWEAELTLKRALKRKGVQTGQKAFREKFDGWNESFQSVDLEVKNLKDLFKRLNTPIPPFLFA